MDYPIQIRQESKNPWAKLGAAGLLLFALGIVVGRLVLPQATNGQAGSAALTVNSTSTAPVKVIGIGSDPAQPIDLGSDLEFSQFWQLWNLLKEKYYEQPVTDKQLFYGSLAGLADSLGDPYTVFFEPVTASEFQESLAGKFEGIGAEIGIKDGQLQIVAPLPDTPAERAGLRAGDFILKIDETETTNMSTEKAVSLIRGPKDTSVTLNIYRPDLKKPPFDVTIVRDEIQIKSVKSEIKQNDLLYIEVTNFNGDTDELFQEVLNKTNLTKIKGIILDLRNDPGGYLDVAQQLAGYWVGDQVVVKERRQGQIIEELKGVGRARLRNIPTVVLVNEGSASASEILAGALQDYELATVVGMKTFGKGSVQDYQNFSDGSAIKITVAEWVTPKERTINKTGLEPDIVVDRTIEDYDAQRDPQLDRAIGLLKGTVPAAATSTPRIR